MDGKSSLNKPKGMFCELCIQGRLVPCVEERDINCPVFSQDTEDGTSVDMEALRSGAITPGITRVYLAGPVDTVSRETATSWRELVAKVLTDHGIICYLPNLPWRGFSSCSSLWQEHAQWIDTVNRCAIHEADAVFANMHRVTIGTTREIEFARSINKPVFAVLREEKRIVCTHDIYLFKSIHSALSELVKYSPKGR